MKKVAEQISGYTYGGDMAGEALWDQTMPLVDHWRREIIGSIPNLSRHSRTPDGEPLPDYQTKSGLRFEQWVLDTCCRPYDRDWLNYQHEIALRHTSRKKNQADEADSTPYVPLRDIIAFIAVMNETIKPYLSAKGHATEDVGKMHGHGRSLSNYRLRFGLSLTRTANGKDASSHSQSLQRPSRTFGGAPSKTDRRTGAGAYRGERPEST
jgi:hypothetical protein